MKVTVKDVKTGRERTMPRAHADILARLGRVTYLTRDMAAALVQSPIQSKMADVQPVEESATNNHGEPDSAGGEWNADLHVSTKLQNADGTWRKKPGAKKEIGRASCRERVCQDG